MDCSNNIEFAFADNLANLLDSFIALQEHQFPSLDRQFSYSSNFDNFTIPTFIDRISLRHERILFNALENHFDLITKHENFCKFCFRSSPNILNRLLYKLLRAGFDKAAINCIEFYLSQNDYQNDWVLSSIISLSFVSDKSFAHCLLSNKKFTTLPSLCSRMSNVLYRMPLHDIAFINYESFAMLLENVPNFHQVALPFIKSNKITSFVISRMRNCKYSAHLTASWVRDHSVSSSEVIIMLHYDLFKEADHLHHYLIYLIDELFEMFDNAIAKRFAFDLLCYCRATYPDKNIPFMHKITAMNLSSGQYKHLIRLIFFKGNQIINTLFTETAEVDFA